MTYSKKTAIDWQYKFQGRSKHRCLRFETVLLLCFVSATLIVRNIAFQVYPFRQFRSLFRKSTPWISPFNIYHGRDYEATSIHCKNTPNGMKDLQQDGRGKKVEGSERGNIDGTYYSNEIISAGGKENSRKKINEQQPGSNSFSSTSNMISKHFITPEQISRIKSSADIVSVIEAHGLQQFSRSYDQKAKAICPFHSDTNPSLSIDGSKGMYKCFACGAGGDVFNFIRNYDMVTNNRVETEKMSFRKAVEYVAREFTNDMISETDEFSNNSARGNHNNTNTYLAEQKKRRQSEKIKLVNSAAADFYGGQLLKESSGLARFHLRERGISPKICRIFALGFAPDVYFGPNIIKTRKWGIGSCVERLKELGFTPTEILDAGLATVTSAARVKLQKIKNREASVEAMNVITKSAYSKNSKSNTFENKTTQYHIPEEEGNIEREEQGLDYSDLMDRFRGRLMVPILDAEGKGVIGFGGRHLDSISTSEKMKAPAKSSKGNSSDESSFKAAKYLNSPETLVFSKKNVLFGMHTTKLALKEMIDNNLASSVDSNEGDKHIHAGSVVIVEGYFDAIALYGAGIKEVTSCMGTGLGYDQLELAAKGAASVSRAGRVTLCFDNDEAGLNAIKRLCGGKMLWDIEGKYNVDIFIATLPSGIKDPAEFIEDKGNTVPDNGGKLFRKEVLKKSMVWTDWYINQIIMGYKGIDEGSFATVCDRLSDFLSMFRNVGFRIKRAYEAAGVLATYIKKENGGEFRSSSALHIQLEADLLDMASRKAMSREALSRRIKRIDGISGLENENTVSRMSRGEGVLSKDSLRTSRSPRKTRNEERNDLQPPKKFKERRIKHTRGKRDSREYPEQAPSLTNHFSGFEFNPTDAQWLKVPTAKHLRDKDQKSLVFLYNDAYKVKAETKANTGKKNNVYFNSNDFLGHEYVENRGEMLLDQNAKQMLYDAEDRLLLTLVQYSPSRQAMKSALVNNLENTPSIIEWSTLEREWLFHCLTDANGYEPLPPEFGHGENISQLRYHLANRTDAPKCAFSQSMNNELSNNDRLDNTNNISQSLVKNETEKNIMLQNTSLLKHEIKKYEQDNENCNAGKKIVKIVVENNNDGTLEKYFRKEVNAFNNSSSSQEFRQNLKAELTVQETLSTMLQATAIKRMVLLKEQWKIVSESLSKISERRDHDDNLERERHDKFENSSPYDTMNYTELEELSFILCQNISIAMKTVNELTESSKYVNSRLLDYSYADGVSGSMSPAKAEDLAKMMDEHYASLPDDTHRPQSPGYDGKYVFGSDDFDDKIGSSFGGENPSSGRDLDSIVDDNEPSENKIDLGQDFDDFLSAFPDREIDDENNISLSLENKPVVSQVVSPLISDAPSDTFIRGESKSSDDNEPWELDSIFE